MAVALICGKPLPPFAGFAAHADLAGRIKAGRYDLVRLSGVDFGYDLAAWHSHLKTSRDGSYTWGRNIVQPRVMKGAIASADWQDAVRELRTREPAAGSARPT